MLSESDIISVHTPANAETNGLISAEKIAKMKPSAILINCTRGPIVDNQALAKALNEDKLAGIIRAYGSPKSIVCLVC